MRMHHFQDPYGQFFLEKSFFGKNVFALCITLLHHKKYQENHYRADIKKSLKIYGVPPKNSAKLYHFKNLSQLKLIPHKN